MKRSLCSSLNAKGYQNVNENRLTSLGDQSRPEKKKKRRKKQKNIDYARSDNI